MVTYSKEMPGRKRNKLILDSQKHERNCDGSLGVRKPPGVSEKDVASIFYESLSMHHDHGIF